jgi:hypothetical protein
MLPFPEDPEPDRPVTIPPPLTLSGRCVCCGAYWDRCRFCGRWWYGSHICPDDC